MSEYRLAKNNKNELTNTDKSNKPAKVSKDTKLIPNQKNYLVKTANGTIALCVKTGKGLIELTNRALATIGRKLKEVDWEKVLLTILKNLFFTTQETNKVYYREIKTYTAKEHYPTQENPYQEQIQGTKTDSIGANKTKGITSKEQKRIKNNSNTKSIENKQNRNILNPQQNYLMIEKQNKQKKEK